MGKLGMTDKLIRFTPIFLEKLKEAANQQPTAPKSLRRDDFANAW